MEYERTTLSYDETVDLLAKLELISQGEIVTQLPIDPEALLSFGDEDERMKGEQIALMKAKGSLIIGNLAQSLQYALEIYFQPARPDVKDRKLYYTERNTNNDRDN